MTNVLPVLLRGLAIGFSIAAPVGPIGILCIRTTLLRGRAAGLAAGLGAATADGLYGLVAAGGLALLLHALVALETPLRLLGGGFLLYLGLAALRAAPPPPGDSGRTTEGGLLRAFLTTFLLTLSNPMTVLSFVAIIGAVGVGATANAAGSPGAGAAPFALVTGVFLGSAAWWLTLTTGVSLFRACVTPSVMAFINRAAGAVIAGFGVWVLAGVVMGVGK